MKCEVSAEIMVFFSPSTMSELASSGLVNFAGCMSTRVPDYSRMGGIHIFFFELACDGDLSLN